MLLSRGRVRSIAGQSGRKMGRISTSLTIGRWLALHPPIRHPLPGDSQRSGLKNSKGPLTKSLTPTSVYRESNIQGSNAGPPAGKFVFWPETEQL